MKKIIKMMTVLFLTISCFFPVQRVIADYEDRDNSNIYFTEDNASFPPVPVIKSVPTTLNAGLIQWSGNIYDIIIYYSGSSLINGIKSSNLTIRNLSVNGTVYYSNSFYRYGISGSSGSISIGKVTIPSNVTSVRVVTTNLQVYFYSSGWLSMKEIYDVISK